MMTAATDEHAPTPSPTRPALLVAAVFSRHPAALDWASQRLQGLHGPLALAGTPFPFSHTGYYAKSMGAGLLKQLLAFERLVDEGCLAPVKRRTIELEAELAALGRFPEPRPVNIDPGVLTLGKFLLASTKDHAHRVYLGQGIFAEVTLRFQAGRFQEWPWTFPDYRETCVLDYLGRARDYYRQRLAAEGGR